MAVYNEKNEKVYVRTNDLRKTDDVSVAQKVHSFTRPSFPSLIQKSEGEIDHTISHLQIKAFLEEYLSTIAPQLDANALEELVNKLMKLLIESSHQYFLSRTQERALHRELVKNVVSNLKEAGASLQDTAKISALMTFLAGAMPLVAYSRIGEDFLTGIKNATGFGVGLDPLKFGQQIGTMCQGGSQMGRDMGEVHKTNSESARYQDQQYADLRRSDSDDDMRKLEDAKQEIKALRQAKEEAIQAKRSFSSQLYSGG